MTKYGTWAIPGLVGSSEGTQLRPGGCGKATLKPALHLRVERVWEDGGGAGAGHTQCQDAMQEGSKETGYTEMRRGSERPEQERISVATPTPSKSTISPLRPPSEVNAGVTPTVGRGN